jgi:hypothetical protein
MKPCLVCGGQGRVWRGPVGNSDAELYFLSCRVCLGTGFERRADGALVAQVGHGILSRDQKQDDEAQK